MDEFDASEFGLTERKDMIRIYVGRIGDDCWYRLDSQEKAIPIKENVLSGVLQSIKVIEKTSEKYEAKLKLDIELMAGNNKRVVVRSGLGSVFSRGFLFSLGVIPEINQKIDISVRPSKNDDKIVFCSLFQRNELAISKWDKEAGLLDLQQKAETFNNLLQDCLQENLVNEEQSFDRDGVPIVEEEVLF